MESGVYLLAAQGALQVQDACNSSGIIRTFALAKDAICEVNAMLGTGTDWKNKHPILFLFTYKLMALAGFEPLMYGEAYSWAESECKRLSDPANINLDYTPYTEWVP